jgi:hypothetical protein
VLLKIYAKSHKSNGIESLTAVHWIFYTALSTENVEANGLMNGIYATS